LSQEDKKFLQIAEEGIARQNGHFMLPLPFRHTKVELPDNKAYVMKRALCQKRKMLKDNQYHHYKGFMDQILANGIQLIWNFLMSLQWKYVATHSNPADEASRGVTATKLLQGSMWIQGPDFLRVTGDLRYTNPPVETDVGGDSDVIVSTITPRLLSPEIEDILGYFSTWHRLKTAVAVFMKVREILQCRVQRRRNGHSDSPEDYRLHVADIDAAEDQIMRWLHWKTFPDEMEKLSSDDNAAGDTRSRAPTMVSKSSSLFSLDPRLVHGVLRVGGRLTRAHLLDSVKHPVILPKKAHVTTLIIQDMHRKLGHAGRNHVLASLRQKYWIIRASNAVRNVIHICVSAGDPEVLFSNRKCQTYLFAALMTLFHHSVIPEWTILDRL